ncbi:hypothetical protein QUF80_12335 [Desulfococcaceae bacterium HSG8]|nr:hypothetical protein [Desulfococcaceae bacterium HSG8]
MANPKHVRCGGFANPPRASRVLLGSDWQIRSMLRAGNLAIPREQPGCCSVRIDKSEPCEVRGICQSPASN